MNEYEGIVEEILNETIAAKKASERKRLVKQKEAETQQTEEMAKASTHKSAKKSMKKLSKSKEHATDNP